MTEDIREGLGVSVISHNEMLNIISNIINDLSISLHVTLFINFLQTFKMQIFTFQHFNQEIKRDLEVTLDTQCIFQFLILTHSQ